MPYPAIFAQIRSDEKETKPPPEGRLGLLSFFDGREAGIKSTIIGHNQVGTGEFERILAAHGEKGSATIGDSASIEVLIIRCASSRTAGWAHSFSRSALHIPSSNSQGPGALTSDRMGWVGRSRLGTLLFVSS